MVVEPSVVVPRLLELVLQPAEVRGLRRRAYDAVRDPNQSLSALAKSMESCGQRDLARQIKDAATVSASALAAITPNMFAALVVVDVEHPLAHIPGAFEPGAYWVYGQRVPPKGSGD